MAWRSPHPSGNPNKRSKDRETKPVITWKDPGVGYGLAKREKPVRYRDPGQLTEAFRARLQLGTAMVTKVPLMIALKDGPVYPLPTLARASVKSANVPVGTLLIYAGTVRVRERVRSNGRTVDMEVPKHTFIVPDKGRCIIHELRFVGYV